MIWRGLSYENGEFKGISAWREDQSMLPEPSNNDRGAALSAKITQLGAQGWELIAVTPYSTNYQVFKEELGSGLNKEERQINANGATFNDMFVFKRAVP